MVLRPLCSSMKRFEVGSWRPVPRFFVVKKGRKIFSRILAAWGLAEAYSRFAWRQDPEIGSIP